MSIVPTAFVLRKSNSGPRFAFVEYEDRRDADDAYHEMHNKHLGRDDILKIEVRFLPAPPNTIIWLMRGFQWARTPPSASWRFDSGRDRERAPRRSPRRGRSPSPRRRDYSPRKDDRRDRDRDRDYGRDSRRDRDRSRSPDPRYEQAVSLWTDNLPLRQIADPDPSQHSDRDRDIKEERDDRDRRDTNGDSRKGKQTFKVSLTDDRSSVLTHADRDNDRIMADTPPATHDDLDIAE